MDKIIELAKQAGAVSYTNRHYPDRPYRTFGPEELQKFYTLARADLEAENAKLNSALEDILFHVEDAMGNEVQPYEIEMAAKRARAALGENE